MARPANSLRSSEASWKEAALPAWRTARRTAAGLKPSWVRPKASSRGEKDDPTGRATPALAGQLDVAGPRPEHPLRQGIVGVGGGPPLPATARAQSRLGGPG